MGDRWGGWDYVRRGRSRGVPPPLRVDALAWVVETREACWLERNEASARDLVAALGSAHARAFARPRSSARAGKST